GNNWAGNALSDYDHTIKFEYKFNNSNEVKRYKANTSWHPTFEYYQVSLSLNGHYGVNELYKNIVKDEKWNGGPINSIFEFTDKQQRVLLKRIYDDIYTASTVNTYYVYDDYGNLSFVIPPKAADKNSLSQDDLDDLCYQYRYDKYNRLVEKKQPGKAWEFIVYDRHDRIVATGPVYAPFTNSNALGWNIIKYDAFGRVAFTGWSTQQPTTSLGRKNFQNNVNGTTNQYVTRINSTIDTIPIGYTNNGTYPASFKLLTVNYYDNYNYPGAITTPATVENQNVTSNLKGLTTGNWVRVLTTSSATLAEKTQI